ncbi:hypothetical protein OOT46_25535 [Aquabacterium sp. A7-Y]|uniref:hypothetical protein n=1 Tax=Aquabacterium sp. A7-Y TaxID=1349605 RepID=UPI00223D757D|nr:hypothetical protein [Aquabacterium sp. A7-Y]MCW7541178.1 hypothetical protein [Aquabacterium sp. A7-Y]
MSRLALSHAVLALALTVVCALDTHAAAAPRYSLTPLGRLEEHGSVYPTALNDLGQVTGGASTPRGGSQEPRAFLWENGVMRDLGRPGRNSGGFDINNRGQITGFIVPHGVFRVRGRRSCTGWLV